MVMVINRTGKHVSRTEPSAGLGRYAVRASFLTVGWSVFLLAGSGAFAADVTVIPRIAVRETYTDNVLLAPVNEQDDFVSVVTPGANIRFDGPRLNGSIDYEANILYFPSQNDAQLRHNLNARLQLEAIKNFFNITAGANVREQFLNRNAGFSFSDDNLSGNRSTVQTYDVSPSFQGNISQFANWVLDYRYGIVFTDQGGPGLPNNPALVFTDSQNHTANLRFSSGPQFRTLTWVASGRLRRTDRDGPGTNFRDDRLRLDLTYQVSRTLGLTGGVGYQRTNLATVTRAGDGVVWDIGFNLRPSRRTSLSARYGRRIRQDVVNANFSYRLNSRTTITANYTDSFQSNQTLLVGQLPGIIIGDNGGVTDPNGFPLPVDQPGFNLDNRNFRQQRGTFGINYRRPRTTFSIFSTYEKRTFNLALPAENSFASTLFVSRQFSRRSSANVRLTYRRDEFLGTTRKDNLYGVQVRYSYSVTRRIAANLSYVRTERRSNVALFDLKENAATLGLSATF